MAADYLANRYRAGRHDCIEHFIARIASQRLLTQRVGHPDTQRGDGAARYLCRAHRLSSSQWPKSMGRLDHIGRQHGQRGPGRFARPYSQTRAGRGARHTALLDRRMCVHDRADTPLVPMVS